MQAITEESGKWMANSRVIGMKVLLGGSERYKQHASIRHFGGQKVWWS